MSLRKNEDGSDRFFPLADSPSASLTSCCNDPGYRGANPTTEPVKDRKLMARYKCEIRKPKKGEWYLSGAVIEAHEAKNDLEDDYHIAEIVIVTPVTRYDVVAVIETPQTA